MGAAVGVLVGYVLGSRAGRDGYAQLVSAWDTITRSEEMRDIVGEGVVMARETVAKAIDALAGARRPAVSRLRRVA